MSEKIPTVKEMQAARFASERNLAYDVRPKGKWENHQARLDLLKEARKSRDRCVAAAKELSDASREWDSIRTQYRGIIEEYPDVKSITYNDVPKTNPFQDAGSRAEACLQFVTAQDQLPAPWVMLEEDELDVGHTGNTQDPSPGRIEAYKAEMENAR